MARSMTAWAMLGAATLIIAISGAAICELRNKKTEKVGLQYCLSVSLRKIQYP